MQLEIQTRWQESSLRQMRDIRGYTSVKHSVEQILSQYRQESRRMVHAGQYGITWQTQLQRNQLFYSEIVCGSSMATIAEIISAVPQTRLWHSNILKFQVNSHSDSSMYSQATALITIKNKESLVEKFACDNFEV